MVRVKVCGITNLGDARAAIEAGAGALGFNFYRRSPRFIEPAAAREIVERLPREILCVGVFVNDERRAVEDVVAESGVGAAQLHGDETPRFCASLAGLRVIKALRVGEEFEPESATDYHVEAILLDSFSRTQRGGTGHTFDWSIARRTREQVERLYLAGGLTPENVRAAVEAVEPHAVDVCSGIERGPGRKDHTRMREFFDALRSLRDRN
ncbi:MAG: phosphoribosylanthranilate isomerase [Acidobacteriota bacterium]|nr:phosphoribosylanthranilate isomerase [Acidobacteriota bacterium]